MRRCVCEGSHKRPWGWLLFAGAPGLLRPSPGGPVQLTCRAKRPLLQGGGQPWLSSHAGCLAPVPSFSNPHPHLAVIEGVAEVPGPPRQAVAQVLAPVSSGKAGKCTGQPHWAGGRARRLSAREMQQRDAATCGTPTLSAWHASTHTARQLKHRPAPSTLSGH